MAESEAVETESSSQACLRCGRPFVAAEQVAAISGSILGDEHTDGYFLCPVCGVYTVVTWWDDFTGIETVRRSGPLERPAGDAQVELIGRCACPWDKQCRCDAHLTYFRGTLD